MKQVKKWLVVLTLVVLAAGALAWAGDEFATQGHWTDARYINKVTLMGYTVYVYFTNGEQLTYTSESAAYWAYLAAQAMAHNLPVKFYYDDTGQLAGLETYRE